MQAKRDEAREVAKAERMEEMRLKNEEVRAKAAQRMQSTLQANRSILKQRRAEYDQQQVENEKRRRCVTALAWPTHHLHCVAARLSQAEAAVHASLSVSCIPQMR